MTEADKKFHLLVCDKLHFAKKFTTPRDDGYGETPRECRREKISVDTVGSWFVAKSGNKRN